MSPVDQTAPPKPGRRRPKPVVWIAAALILLALVAGTVGSLAARADSADTSAEPVISEPESTPAANEPAQRRRAPKPARTKKPTSDTAQTTHRFTSCNDVWASGQGPFKRGDPDYTNQLDPDGDGIACPSKPLQ